MIVHYMPFGKKMYYYFVNLSHKYKSPRRKTPGTGLEGILFAGAVGTAVTTTATAAAAALLLLLKQAKDHKAHYQRKYRDYDDITHRVPHTLLGLLTELLRNSRYSNTTRISAAMTVNTLKLASPVMRPPNWYTIMEMR